MAVHVLEDLDMYPRTSPSADACGAACRLCEHGDEFACVYLSF